MPVLPFEAMEENIPKLKKLFVDYYRSSALNQCTHQVPPLVESSLPLSLMVDPSGKPTAVHKPALVSLHFMDEVREGLEKDVCLEVWERVPENTPTTWYSQMYVVVKNNFCHAVHWIFVLLIILL